MGLLEAGLGREQEMERERRMEVTSRAVQVDAEQEEAQSLGGTISNDSSPDGTAVQPRTCGPAPAGLASSANGAERAHILREKAEEGHAAAMFNLGFCYDKGEGGVQQDARQAFAWYKRAAEQQLPAALYAVGYCYSNGVGVGADEREAVAWYVKAAHMNNVRAQYALAYCYRHGVGMEERDQEKCIYWYQKAAEQGHPKAQANLGWCYEYGDGVEKSPSLAVRWYRRAAEQGYHIAQYYLGYCYRYGKGVDVNFREAARWYMASAKRGTHLPPLPSTSTLNASFRILCLYLSRFLLACLLPSCGTVLTTVARIHTRHVHSWPELFQRRWT